jgi:putative SOS response-associated peptidase YedK
MCGRFNLRTPASQLAAFFDIVFDPPLQTSLAPHFNIAPSQPVLVVRRAAAADRTEGALVHWGLVPSWAKDPSIGNRMINARGETVAEKPSFRSAFRHRRCLVPASGFYEWQKMTGSRKQPWHIHRPDDAPLAFAGIWEHWEAEDGSVLQTCAIITTDANSQMAPIHHRMPVILDPPDFPAWLDPQHDDHDQLQRLLQPCPDETLVADPIDTWVNRPANDGPDCLRPVDESAAGDGVLFE